MRLSIAGISAKFIGGQLAQLSIVARIVVLVLSTLFIQARHSPRQS